MSVLIPKDFRVESNGNSYYHISPRYGTGRKEG
jgi:hypothetical protein